MVTCILCCSYCIFLQGATSQVPGLRCDGRGIGCSSLVEAQTGVRPGCGGSALLMRPASRGRSRASSAAGRRP
jgi:hypothetical protein